MTSVRRLYYPLCRTRVGHIASKLAFRTLRAAGLQRHFHLPFDALELDHAALSGLASLWSRIHWSAGDGMMPAEQLLAIYRLAVQWPVRGDVVELGSWTGLTTCYLATACRVRRQGHVYAVDTFAGHKEGHSIYDSIARHGGCTRGAFDRRVRAAELSDRITPLVGLTSDIARTYPGKPIRLLLIDADHSFEGVRGDFESWLPHMAEGGLIVFHDHLMPEVARFVDHHLHADHRVSTDPGLVVSNVYGVTFTGSNTRSVDAIGHTSRRMAGIRTAAANRLVPMGESQTAMASPEPLNKE